MRLLFALLLLVGGAVIAQAADPTLADAQKLLKDQGYYYGAINGQKDADTSAAVRRFQIRNGLEITGELNEETLKALRNAPATTPFPAASAPVQPRQEVQPPPEDDTSDLRDYPNGAPGPPVQPSGAVPGEALPPDQGKVMPSRDGLFAGTPYANASPEIQRRVIADAQRVLGGKGLYKNPPDGFFSPDLEFSLRAYQSRVGLTTSGRLDLETLAALELLPGARMPVYTPRRRPPPGFGEPPVRGEWIRR